MEDKTFELLTKIYTDFSKRFDNIESEQKSMKSDINGMKSDINGLKNNVICLESKFDNNIKALFDGYKQTYEELKEVKYAVKDLSSKLEKQEVEIKVIKGGK